MFPSAFNLSASFLTAALCGADSSVFGPRFAPFPLCDGFPFVVDLVPDALCAVFTPVVLLCVTVRVAVGGCATCGGAAAGFGGGFATGGGVAAGTLGAGPDELAGGSSFPRQTSTSN